MPPRQPYQGTFRPERVQAVMRARLQRERGALHQALGVLADELGGQLRATPTEPATFETKTVPNASWPQGYAYQLVLGDEAVAPSADV